LADFAEEVGDNGADGLAGCELSGGSGKGVADRSPAGGVALGGVDESLIVRAALNVALPREGVVRGG
jgi:hypothetical protein